MESSAKGCVRGRPRSFCCDQALDAALRVFWEKGYEAASLDELTAAMKINRPSLYAAFGNKESLFRQALERYAERGRNMMAAALAEPTARAAVTRLLHDAIDAFTDPDRPGGCFTLQAGLARGAASEIVREALCAKRSAMETALNQRLAEAVAAGELPATTAPTDLARYIGVVLQGLAIQAAQGVPREALQRAGDLALRAWPA